MSNGSVAGALDGIRVLDLSRVLAGPWCTQNLADLGAEVIKVERPKTGDDTRAWGPPFFGQDGDDPQSAYFLSANRNKRSITCDLSTADGQEIVRDLARRSHILVENFKVGDMARHGLDYAALRRVNPSLVYCSVTGFGQTGPYRDRAGYDYVVQGMGGLMSITGERDELGGGPQKAGVAVADLFTGMYATVAVLAALRHAEQSGEGQHVDMALLDTQVAMLANLGASCLVGGRTPRRIGNAHQAIVPYQVFEVAQRPGGERDFIIVAVGNDSQFRRYCAVVGRPELADDPRFGTNAARVENRGLLIGVLEPLMRNRTKAHWLDALESATVPCGPINDLSEAFADPQVRERGMVTEWKHPASPRPLGLVGSPMKLSATPVRRSLPPPLLGQHTTEVLQGLLGFSEERIGRLRQAAVI